MKNQIKLFSISLLLSIVSIAQNVADGLKFMDMEQYANARKLFLALPQTADNLYYLGDFYVKMSQIDTSITESLDSALTNFNKGISLDPKSALNFVGQGAVYYLKGNPNEAGNKFKTALDFTKNKNPEVLYKIGESYLYKGRKDISIAIAHLEKASQLAPKNTDYQLALGDAYLIADDGNASRAVKQYGNVLALNPKLSKAHIKNGKIYLQAKNYDEALVYYNKGVEADQSYSPAYRERAELYFKLKQYRNVAPAEYKKYLSMSDGNYKSKLRFAIMSYKNEDFNTAFEQINILQKENPNDRIPYRISAYSYYESAMASKDTAFAKANFKTGLEQIKMFFELSKDTTKIIPADYEYYGKLLTKTGNDSLGSMYLLKVVAKDSTRFEIYNDLAKAANEKKKYKKAAAYFTKYYTYKKPGLNDLLTWGRAYYNGDDFVNADSVFKKLVVQKPEELLGHKWRAFTNESIDLDRKTGAAIPFYEKFIEMANQKDATKYKSDIIKGYTYIGAYYLNIKNTSKSIEIWKKIGTLEPTDSNYLFMKNHLNSKNIFIFVNILYHLVGC